MTEDESIQCQSPIYKKKQQESRQSEAWELSTSNTQQSFGISYIKRKDYMQEENASSPRISHSQLKRQNGYAADCSLGDIKQEKNIERYQRYQEINDPSINQDRINIQERLQSGYDSIAFSLRQKQHYQQRYRKQWQHNTRNMYKIRELEAKIAQFKSRHNITIQQVSSQKMRCQGLQKKKKQLERLLQQKKSQATESQNKIQKLKQDNSDLLNKISNKQSQQIIQLRKKSEQMQKNKEPLQSQKEEIINSKSSLAQEIQSIKTEKLKMEQFFNLRISQLESELKSKQQIAQQGQKTAQNQKEYINSLEKQKKQLNDKVNLQAGQIESLKNSADTQNSEKNIIISDLKNEIDKQKYQIEQLKQRKTDLQSNLIVTQNEKNNLANQNSNYKRDLEVQRKKLIDQRTQFQAKIKDSQQRRQIQEQDSRSCRIQLEKLENQLKAAKQRIQPHMKNFLQRELAQIFKSQNVSKKFKNDYQLLQKLIKGLIDSEKELQECVKKNRQLIFKSQAFSEEQLNQNQHQFSFYYQNDLIDNVQISSIQENPCQASNQDELTKLIKFVSQNTKKRQKLCLLLKLKENQPKLQPPSQSQQGSSQVRQEENQNNAQSRMADLNYVISRQDVAGDAQSTNNSSDASSMIIDP